MNKMEPSDWFTLGAFLSGLAVVVWLVVMLVRADGRVTFCWVDEAPRGIFTLYGHRDWRPDADLGRYISLRDATEAAKAHGCTLGVK